MYLSHRTVASHLYRVYPKPGITSRSQLHVVLPSSGARPPVAASLGSSPVFAYVSHRRALARAGKGRLALGSPIEVIAQTVARPVAGALSRLERAAGLAAARAFERADLARS